VSESRGRHSAGTVTTARPVPAGDPAALEAQIEQTREQLAETIDQIAERVRPRNLARRLADRARSVVIDENGQVRADRVVMIGGAVVAWVGLVIWRRSR
jgi:uncharacterized protein DUF3618